MNDIRDDAAGLFGWSFPPASDAASRLCVLGAPSDAGNAVRRGAADAPSALRTASHRCTTLTGAGWDLGDLPRVPCEHPERYMQRLGDAIGRIVDSSHIPLLLGGDHSLSFASIEALQRHAPLCVVWLDAHTDFSPWQAGSSHNHRQVLRRVLTLPGVSRVIQIGYRGITVGDERQLGPRAKVMTTQQARSQPVGALLESIPADMPIYLSLDIDVIDPQWIPGTSAPVPDGLPPGQVLEIALALVETGRLVGVDLMELNPRLDINGRSTDLACHLLERIAGMWPRDRAISDELKGSGAR
ncbi:arginase family protein [Stenotrophomonas sp. SMYL11]|uniref:arginase family protein n=1 Tax=Stenotrophomonas sp. SMYL11 TaxID=3076042 RepID=UPI002E79D41A|nr:arginase family protein [Stenotrophomonas sp. SMYL11]